MSISIDVSEVLALADDIKSGAAKVMEGVRPAVVKGATNIKDQLRSEASGSASFGHIAPTITFDMTGNAAFSQAEIGPTKPRGALAAIAHFGGSNGGGATVADPSGAMDAEAPRFEQAIGDLVDGML